MSVIISQVYACMEAGLADIQCSAFDTRAQGPCPRTPLATGLPTFQSHPFSLCSASTLAPDRAHLRQPAYLAVKPAPSVLKMCRSLASHALQTKCKKETLCARESVRSRSMLRLVRRPFSMLFPCEGAAIPELQLFPSFDRFEMCTVAPKSAPGICDKGLDSSLAYVCFFQLLPLSQAVNKPTMHVTVVAFPRQAQTQV